MACVIKEWLLLSAIASHLGSSRSVPLHWQLLRKLVADVTEATHFLFYFFTWLSVVYAQAGFWDIATRVEASDSVVYATGFTVHVSSSPAFFSEDWQFLATTPGALSVVSCLTTLHAHSGFTVCHTSCFGYFIWFPYLIWHQYCFLSVSGCLLLGDVPCFICSPPTNWVVCVVLLCALQRTSVSYCHDAMCT